MTAEENAATSTAGSRVITSTLPRGSRLGISPHGQTEDNEERSA